MQGFNGTNGIDGVPGAPGELRHYVNDVILPW